MWRLRQDVCKYIVRRLALFFFSWKLFLLCFSSVDVAQKWINYCPPDPLSSTIVSRWAVSCTGSVETGRRDTPCVFIHPLRWFTRACFIRLSQPSPPPPSPPRELPSRVNLAPDESDPNMGHSRGSQRAPSNFASFSDLDTDSSISYANDKKEKKKRQVKKSFFNQFLKFLTIEVGDDWFFF